MKRSEPDGELKIVQIGSKADQTTRINKSLSTSLKEKILTLLKKNADLFAWTAFDMPPLSNFPWGQTSSPKKEEDKLG